MSDSIKSWIEERRAIHANATEDTARVLWEHDDPEGESPNENFESEPKWEQERLKLTARAMLESSDAHNMFPRALDALNAALELHKPIFYYEHEDSCMNTDEDHRAERHVEFDLGEYYCEVLPTGEKTCEFCHDDEGEHVGWPCPTVQAIEGAIEGAIND